MDAVPESQVSPSAALSQHWNHDCKRKFYIKRIFSYSQLTPTSTKAVMGKKRKGKKSSEVYRELLDAHMKSHPLASTLGNSGVAKRPDPRHGVQRLHAAHSRLDSMQGLFTGSRGTGRIVRPLASVGGGPSPSGFGSHMARGRINGRWERRDSGREQRYSSSLLLQQSSSLLITGSDTRYGWEKWSGTQ